MYLNCLTRPPLSSTQTSPAPSEVQCQNGSAADFPVRRHVCSYCLQYPSGYDPIHSWVHYTQQNFNTSHISNIRHGNPSGQITRQELIQLFNQDALGHGNERLSIFTQLEQGPKRMSNQIGAGALPSPKLDFTEQ
jgi:hypothetical protein